MANILATMLDGLAMAFGAAAKGCAMLAERLRQP